MLFVIPVCFSLLTYTVMNSNSQKLACANKESVGTDLQSKMVLNMYNVREDATLKFIDKIVNIHTCTRYCQTSSGM